MAGREGLGAARAVVRRAGAAFGLEWVGLRPVAVGIDWTFRARAMAGGVLAVRVGDPGNGQSLRAVASEMAWLEALEAGTDLEVPRVVRTTDGQLAARIVVDGSAFGVTAVGWLPGRRNRARVTAPQAAELGRISAAVHAHGQVWARPSWFERRPWTAPMMTGAHRPGDRLLDDVVGAGRAGVLRRVDGLVADAARDLWRRPGAAGLVHGDLHPGNVLWRAGAAQLIDFNDSGDGLHAYDLARTLRTLRWRPNGDELVRAALDGYQAAAGRAPVGWDDHGRVLEAGADLNALRYYTEMLAERGDSLRPVIEATARRIEHTLSGAAPASAGSRSSGGGP